MPENVSSLKSKLGLSPRPHPKGHVFMFMCRTLKLSVQYSLAQKMSEVCMENLKLGTNEKNLRLQPE